MARIQRRAADEAAVDVRLRQQLSGVGRLHRAAVLHRDGPGNARAVQMADGAANEGADLCRLLGSGGLAGAYEPVWAIGTGKTSAACWAVAVLPVPMAHTGS